MVLSQQFYNNYIMTIIMIWISKDFTQWCFTRNKILTERTKYVINQALNALFISKSMICFFAH